MRSLASLLVVVMLAVGIYVLYLKKMPSGDEGTAPTQAISLTGLLPRVRPSVTLRWPSIPR